MPRVNLVPRDKAPPEVRAMYDVTCSAPMAVTETGTSCSDSSRRWAVTTTASISTVAALVSAWVWAAASSHG